MAMFPPIDDAILRANPKFAVLHKTLTTRILNPDGSTIQPTSPDSDAKAETLKVARIAATKAELLRTSLASLPLTTQAPAATGKLKSPQSPLPQDLIEVILLLTLHLTSPASTSTSTSNTTNATTRALISSAAPFAHLSSHLPAITTLLSTHLHTAALALTRLLHPNTDPSFRHRHIPLLPTTLTTNLVSLSTKNSALLTQRSALTPLTTTLLSTYLSASSLAIHALERTKHGALSRHTAAHTALVATESQTVKYDAEIKGAEAVAALYTEDVKGALGRYGAHLKGERARLRERKEQGQRELGRYGVGGTDERREKMMREIARVFGEMEGAIAEVRADVERLERA